MPKRSIYEDFANNFGKEAEKPEKIVKEPEKVESKPKAVVKPTKVVGKRSDPNYQQTTAYIPKVLHKKIMKKIYQEKEYSELIEELLTEYLNK